jgi:hypothetical protein
MVQPSAEWAQPAVLLDGIKSRQMVFEKFSHDAILVAR